ncbi:MAG: sulfur carrier protein ThiS [Pseudomonadota bacterium]
MRIMLNGTPREVQAKTLAEALSECGLSGRVATAVNEVFVPVSQREAHGLTDGDRVEVLGAMQGG